MRVTPSSTLTDIELQESEREREELKYKFDQQEAQIQALKNQLHIKNAVEVAQTPTDPNSSPHQPYNPAPNQYPGESKPSRRKGTMRIKA